MFCCGDMGEGKLTRPSRREERRNPRPSGTDPLRQRPLRAKLDANLAREVLLLEDLVVAEEGEHEAAELARLDEEGEAALALLAGVVGDGCEGVEGAAAAGEG